MLNNLKSSVQFSTIRVIMHGLYANTPCAVCFASVMNIGPETAAVYAASDVPLHRKTQALALIGLMSIYVCGL